MIGLCVYACVCVCMCVCSIVCVACVCMQCLDWVFIRERPCKNFKFRDQYHQVHMHVLIMLIHFFIYPLLHILIVGFS